MSESPRPPSWQRPPGVAEGTWKYVHQRTIASHYDDFVADTPLCSLDLQITQAFLQRVGGRVPVERSKLVADLGCGTGRLSHPVARLGWDVLAIDLSRPMLDELLAKQPPETDHGDDHQPVDSPSSHLGTLHPIRANLVELGGIRDGIADAAICMFSTLGMIQGRRHRIALLRHAHRIVGDNGELLLHVHRRWAALRERGGIGNLIRSFARSVTNRDAEFGDRTYAYRGLEDMFMHRYSLNELTSDLGQAGWQPHKVAWVHISGAEVTNRSWNAGGMILECRRQS